MATAPAPATAAPRVEPVLTGAFKIDLPKRESKRGSESKYDFAGLEVGSAFGVKNKTAKQLASIVSAANRKNSEPVRDENGNATYRTKEIDNGQGGKVAVPDTKKPITRPTKHFYAVDVDAAMVKLIKGTPLEGSKALVYRDA